MTFARPEALVLLLVLLPVLWLEVRSARQPRRSIAAAVLRGLFLAALVLALARPAVPVKVPAPVRVLAVDFSASAGPEASVQAAFDRALSLVPEGEEVRAVLVGAEVREIPADPVRPRHFPRLATLGLDRRGSALEDGLDLAGALVPAEAGGGIVLLSDGRGTQGSVLQMAARCAERRLPIDVVGLGERAPRPVLRWPSLPASAPVGSSIPVEVLVEAPDDGTFTAVFRGLRPETAARTVPVVVQGGHGAARLVHEVPAEGLNEAELVLADAQGQPIEGARVPVAFEGRPPVPVRLVRDRDAPSARAGIAALLGAGFAVEDIQAQDLTGAEDWSAAPLAILDDVPAAALAPAVQEALRSAVAGGLGLFVAGGRRSFGPGGYAQTPLEDVLPVRFVQKEERRDPSATLVIIIDTSGSMMGNRIELAKEVARLALRRLKPHDKAGIVEFHGAKRWAAPIQPASNAVDLQRALNRLVAGGGTVILPAIEEAYYGLLNVRTRTRHVLVITDGGVEQGPFEPLIRKMADHGLTVSTVLVGASAGHSAFLVSLAQWGRGRFYCAPDRFNLPEVLVKQPESSLLSPWSEAPVGVRADDGSFAGRDLDLSGAEIGGVVQTEARVGAEVLLKTEGQEPLLARWRHGLGVCAAWTSEIAGPWTGGLARHPEYARLVCGVLRETSRPVRSGEVRLEIVLRGDVLTVYALPPAEAPGGGRIVVRVRDGRGFEQRRVAAFGPAAAGEPPVGQVFEHLPAGTLAIIVESPDGAELARGAVARPETSEWTAVDPDVALLDHVARLTGGRREALSPPSAGEGRAQREIWPLGLGAALAAFLLLVLVRRLPLRAAASILVLLPLLAPSAPAQAVTATASATVSLSPDALAPPAAPADAPQEVREPLPPEVLELLRHAAAPDGAAALAEAMRLVRARDGSLDRLVEHLQGECAKTPDAEAPALLLAQVVTSAGKPAIGVAPLAALSERTPLTAAGWAALGRLQETLGKDEEALALLERALAAAPPPALGFALQLRRASLLFTLPKRSKDGLDVLRGVLAAHPGEPDLSFYLAYLGALNGEPALMLGLDARAGEHAFQDHLVIGTFHLRAGRFDDAKRHFEAAIAAGPLQRDRRFAQERLIAAHRAAGTLPQICEQWLAAADRSDERLEALVAVLRELKRPQEALDLLLSGRPGAAESAADETVQREVIGLALESGRDQEVETTYTALIKREPRRLGWRSGLALLYLLRGERARAQQVFLDALAETTDGKQCLRLAQGARDLALTDPAVTAAEKALGADEASRIRAHLFLADIDFQKGLSEVAGERLKKVEAEFPASDDALLQAADAWDRYQREDEAVRVLKVVADRTAGEDVVMRLAWLLEKRKQTKDALDLWLRLWRETKIPARSRQAEDRVLELASKEAKLADLAIDLEESLEKGPATGREMSLLVKIYAQANDPVAAVEILKEHGRRLGKGEAETLQDMARVYQHCDDYRRYEETLHQLQEVDPAQAVDYQEQLALGALERGRGRQVKRALDRLKQISGNSLEAEEFSAGALALVQLHDEAAAAYARVLAAHPDRIESWLLLGNALRDAGRRDEALYAFLDLCETADKDDLFTIAIDGLLNLRAGRPVLVTALRRVKERIAERPAKAFLYQLAADLEEELSRPEGQVAMTSLMALVGGERRAPILRELMEMSQGRNSLPDLILYGRSLMALGEAMPPEVFLDLGEALVKSGDLPGAERVFGRTRQEGDFVAMQQKIAGYYEAAGYYGDAERLMRQALLARPDDAELLVNVGGLAETSGHREQAARDFAAAADLLLRRSPSKVADPADTKKGRNERRTVYTASGPMVIFISGGSYEYDPNADPYDRLAPEVIKGLVANSGPELIASLDRRIAEEVELLDRGEARSEKLSGNLRLARLHSVAREVAFALGDLDWADRLEERVLRAYPKDADERKRAVEERLTRGLLSRGRYLAGALGLNADEEFAVLKRDTLLRGSGSLDKILADGQVAPETAADLLPALLLRGQAAEAARLLKAVDLHGERPKIEEARVLVCAALALDDHELLQAWFLRWVESAFVDSPGAAAAPWLETQIRQVWGLLDAEGRTAVQNRLGEIAGRAKKERRGLVQRVRLELARDLDWKLDLPRETFEEMLDQGARNLHELLDIVLLAPEDEQPRLLTLALEKARNVYRPQLIDFLDKAQRELPAEMSDRLIEAFRVSGRKARAGAAPTVEWWEARRLCELTRNLPIAERMLDVLLTETPGDPLLGAARGAILRRLDRAAEADELLSANLKKLLRKKTLEWNETDLIDNILNADDDGARDVVLRVVEELEKDGGRTPPLLVIRARILDREGRLAEAGELLKTAFKEDQEADQLRRALEGNLTQRGRLAEAVALTTEWLHGRSADDNWAYNDLAEKYRQLERPVAAIAALERGAQAANLPLKIALEMGLGRGEAAAQSFRRLLSQVRGQRFFGGWSWPQPSGAGGLEPQVTDWDEDGNPVAVPGRPVVVGPAAAHVYSVYWRLAEEPWGLAEMERAMKARGGQGAIANDALIAGYARAGLLAEPREATVARLAARIRDGELTSLEMYQIIVLAGIDPEKFPAALQPGLDQIRERMVAAEDPDSNFLQGLADLYLKTGRVEPGRAILLWLLAENVGLRDRAGQSVWSFGLVDRYVDSYPEAERTAVRRRLLQWIEPSAGLSADGSFDLTLAEQLEKAGDAEGAARRVAALEASLRKPPAADRVSQVFSGHRALARWYAQRGDRESFRRHLLEMKTLRKKKVKGLYFNPTMVLPSAKQATEPAALAAALRPVFENEAPRTAAEWKLDVAAWLARGGDPAAAKPWLDEAAPYLGDSAAARLLVADIARKAGDADRGYTIEKELLGQDALNLRRLPRLLDEMAKREGEEAARAAAVRAAAYSDHPAALRRAAEAALDAGDREKAAGLLDRWAVMAPKDPDLARLRGRL